MSDWKSLDQDESDLNEIIDDDHSDNYNKNKSSKNKNIKETIYRTKFVYSCETEYCTLPAQIDVKPGELLVMQTRYGRDLVQYLGPMRDLSAVNMENLREVVRKATDEDIKKLNELKNKEPEAIRVCKEKIKKHGLEMKLVNAHYLVDESKVMFFFTADNRIDFRELVKDLVSIFRMRIELRQIGVRDESRILGGIAVCGRCYCCNQVTDKLRPVSIKMAKEQNLSLNSLKISGPCGRLLCCLSYEYDYYVEAKRDHPPEGYRFNIKKDTFRVTDVNIFTKRLFLSGPEGRHMELPAIAFKKKKDGRNWIIKDEYLEN